MKNEKEARVFLADDHNILRTSLRLYLEQNGYVIAGEAQSGTETLKKVPVLQPDIILLDITFSDMGGINVAEKLLSEDKALRILILTMHDEEDYLLPAIQAGAMGYVNKSAAGEELLRAIETVLDGRFYVGEAGKQLLIRLQAKGGKESRSQQQLSERELEVLRYVAKGYTCREIAEQLYLSTRTVETYRLRLMRKLGIKNRFELVEYAKAHRLV